MIKRNVMVEDSETVVEVDFLALGVSIKMERDGELVRIYAKTITGDGFTWDYVDFTVAGNPKTVAEREAANEASEEAPDAESFDRDPVFDGPADDGEFTDGELTEIELENARALAEYVVDNALSPDHGNEDINVGAVLVTLDCEEGEIHVAVIAYTTDTAGERDTMDDWHEAAEIARDWVLEHRGMNPASWRCMRVVEAVKVTGDDVEAE